MKKMIYEENEIFGSFKIKKKKKYVFKTLSQNLSCD